MTSLIVMAMLQLLLVLVLLAIVSKLIDMVKAGAPLVSLRRPRSSKRSKSVNETAKAVRPPEEPAKVSRVISFKLPIPGRGKEKTEASPEVPVGIVAPAGRSRRLLTLSELESASNRAAAHFPEDYYAEVEAKLEGLFQDYLSQTISLADYLDKVRKERAITQAVLRNGSVLIDPELRGEAERAAAAIDWCLDWASDQISCDSTGLAA